jgi:hypothetical protein
MFNFDNFENVTNKVMESSDVKVYANNKIRIGTDAKSKLGIDSSKNVLVLKNNATGEIVIAAVDAEGGQGRKINSAGEFSNQLIASILGGVKAEWNLAETGVAHPVTGDTYFLLEKVEVESTTEVEEDDDLPEINIIQTVESGEESDFETSSQVEESNIYETVENELDNTDYTL